MRMEINLNNKTFASISNSENGEVSPQTKFLYKQDGNIVWAEYGGGDIVKGFLIGKISDTQLDFNYQHVNEHGELMTGKCTSVPEVLPDGKIMLHEKWEWTCKDFSNGESKLIEV